MIFPQLFLKRAPQPSPILIYIFQTSENKGISSVIPAYLENNELIHNRVYRFRGENRPVLLLPMSAIAEVSSCNFMSNHKPSVGISVLLLN